MTAHEAPGRCAGLALALALLLALAPACDSGGGGGGEGDGGGEVVPFECELVLRDPSGAGHLDLETSHAVELIWGFQGFLFIEVFARAAGDDLPASVTAAHSVTLGDDPPFGDKETGVDFDEDGAGARVTDPLLIFLDGFPAEYEGLEAELTLKLTGEGRECITSGTVLFVDEDDCIHTGEEPICTEDGEDGG